ncbi:AMP-binding protein [Herbiconiux sp. KACC 21604]|uniref:AMP-binding protein n=1 Tax=unclassified Herbiconiux TaxID=2618217 RepID=UPI0020A388A9|nr:AMP-binding protein [Herbiconiux sp. SALV-R1]WPO87642.1 AMP-binding protein [Herbiconiux sp. KACC 21604]
MFDGEEGDSDKAMNDYANRPWLTSYSPKLAPTIDEVPFSSLGELVDATCSQFAGKPAYSNLGAVLSFADVKRLSDQFAAYLVGDLGLAKGDRIVLQMPNLLQYPIAVYGALKAGLVVVNANPLYTAHEMKKVFVDSGAVAIVVLENFADKLASVVAETSIRHVILTEVGDLLPGVKRVVTNFVVKRVRHLVPAHDLPSGSTVSVTRWRDVLASGARLGGVRRAAASNTSGGPGVKLPSVGLEDTALLQYTGGTTGGTKAAIITHHNLLANQAQMLAPMKLRLHEGEETVIAALPLYHIFSLTVNALAFFAYGSHNVLITNPRDTDDLVKTLAKTKPSVLILVSTLAGALMENTGFRSLDHSGVKLAVAGGMAVRMATAQQWREVTGGDMLEGYGLTEASPVVSVNPTWETPRVGTIGLPLPSTDIEIRDEEGAVVPLGEPGELCVRGPQVMSGYWNQPEPSAAVLRDGWLLTGDVATMAPDGFLTIVDRKKDMVVVSGFNVYPSEVEEVAMLHPQVKDAGVIGVDDDRSGETIVLFVVPSDPSLTEDELRTYLKGELAGYKRPTRILFRDELPKSNVGKVLRRELRDLLDDDKK